MNFTSRGGEVIRGAHRGRLEAWIQVLLLPSGSEVRRQEGHRRLRPPLPVNTFENECEPSAGIRRGLGCALFGWTAESESGSDRNPACGGSETGLAGVQGRSAGRFGVRLAQRPARGAQTEIGADCGKIKNMSKRVLTRFWAFDIFLRSVRRTHAELGLLSKAGSARSQRTLPRH